jgi:hypothetical protein
MTTTTARTESLQPLLERLDQIEQRVSRLETIEEPHRPHQPEVEEDKSRDEAAIETNEDVPVSSYWLKPARATESFAASLRIGLICLAALGLARWGSLIGSPAKRSGFHGQIGPHGTT